MKFQEALELLKEGDSVARAGWAQSEGYLVFLKGMNHVWKIIPLPAPNAGNHIFSVAELCAEDWVKFSEKEYDADGNAKLPDDQVDAPEANVEL